MCFFNRFRFQCGHQQYVIFQLCPSARLARGRTYHTSCRPSKRSTPNFRKWEILGLCENCLKRQYGFQYGHTPRTSLYSHGVGVPGTSSRDYNYDTYEDGYPYHPNAYVSPSGYEYNYNYNHGRRSSSYIPRVNPDECDAPGCMTISTPKDINNTFYRSGYGRPHMGSRRLLDAPYSYPYTGTGDGRWGWDRDDNVAGRMSPRLDAMQMLEDAERYDGLPMRGDPYMHMRRASGRVAPEMHLVD
ncbi:hypothetical protein TWF696_002062 [Orbilia brochopaga]|uniref:Uncharacterized protein n=1 Tax=Orbilia brochopaga TaxID=3140254 RepID=A0AAV9UB52_9PEZI